VYKRQGPSTWEDRGAAPDREAVRAARKANKDAVKEAKREQRKVKMPKHLKKKRVKNTSGKK
jgi:RIO kinase 1